VAARERRPQRGGVGQAGLREQLEGGVPDRGGGFGHRHQPRPHRASRRSACVRRTVSHALEQGRAPPFRAGTGGAVHQPADLRPTAGAPRPRPPLAREAARPGAS
jgi:hypothetical protein